MSVSKLNSDVGGAHEAAAAHFSADLQQAETEAPKAWELIDAKTGRYMPRRIRGSFRGRALG